MINEKTSRAVWILVSAFFLRHTHLTHFKVAVYFVLNIVLNLKAIQKKRCFDIIFLFQNCNVISIGKLNNPKLWANLSKPEVFVLFSKDWGLGSQSYNQGQYIVLNYLKLKWNSGCTETPINSHNTFFRFKIKK